jgi:cellulose synthase/poly-beta-1,6-N-acetylglucosamine synthase-like glycosyltransferase
VPPPYWLARLVAALQNDKSIVGVYGPLRLLDGSSFADFCTSYLAGAFVWLNGAIGRPTFCGPNFAVRRDAWVQVGGFDTDWISAEDVNLSLKLVRVGKVQFRWDIRVATSARRCSLGVARVTWYGMANYLRVAWQRRPPLPFDNIR